MPYKKVEKTESVIGGNPIRIKYKDVFEFKPFYESLHEWLMHYGWSDIEKEKDHWETAYVERIDRNGAKEIWISWRTYKDAEGGPFRYYLDFNFHLLGLTSTEVVKDGMKLKVNKGELELHINAVIEKTYEEGLKKIPFIGQFTELFNKRVYRQEYEERKKEFYQEVYVLQNFIKQWFKLKRYLPYEETKSFFPSMAWPSHLKD
jgi:hypothetical protein